MTLTLPALLAEAVVLVPGTLPKGYVGWMSTQCTAPTTPLGLGAVWVTALIDHDHARPAGHLRHRQRHRPSQSQWGER